MLRRLKNALLAPLRPVDRYVLVHYPVVAMMREAVATCEGQPESGGILLGSVRGPHLEITGFTTPARADERTMVSFVRQDRSHQAAADQALNKSDHEIGFIGEWHTHPSGSPIPSIIDQSSWAELAGRCSYPMCFLLASPQGWRGFHVASQKPGTSYAELVEHERGVLGVVFR